MQSAVSPADRTALITRALAATAPVDVLTIALWLVVPHTAGAHEGWVVAFNLALAPVYLALLMRRSLMASRVGMNVAGVAAIASTTADLWAGGGLASGFELAASGSCR